MEVSPAEEGVGQLEAVLEQLHPPGDCRCRSDGASAPSDRETGAWPGWTESESFV